MRIFRPGTHTSKSGTAIAFSDAELARVAELYDPAKRPAPLCLGHPKDDSPAFGTFESLEYKNGELVGKLVGAPEGFREFAEKAYTGLSPAFYPPDSPYNPAPGNWYLRHVALTNFPAVAGLKPEFSQFSFAESDNDFVEFGQWGQTLTAQLLSNLREWIIETQGSEVADKVLPKYQIDSIQEDSRYMPDQEVSPGFSQGEKQESDKVIQEFSQKQAAIAQLQADLEKQKAEFAQQQATLKQQIEEQQAREARLQRQEFEAFAQTLLDEGRQFNKSLAASLFMGLPEGDRAVEFSEAGQEVQLNQREAFKRLLSSLPKVVDFSEKAKAEFSQESTEETALKEKLKAIAARYEKPWRAE